MEEDLISGIGSIIKQIYPKCNIIGIEPEGAKGLSESLFQIINQLIMLKLIQLLIV